MKQMMGKPEEELDDCKNELRIKTHREVS